MVIRINGSKDAKHNYLLDYDSLVITIRNRKQEKNDKKWLDLSFNNSWYNFFTGIKKENYQIHLK